MVRQEGTSWFYIQCPQFPRGIPSTHFRSPCCGRVALMTKGPSTWMVGTRQSCSAVIYPSGRNRNSQATGGRPAPLIKNPNPKTRVTLWSPIRWAKVKLSDAAQGCQACEEMHRCPWLVKQTWVSPSGRLFADVYQRRRHACR